MTKAKEAAAPAKKTTNPLVFVGVGCLVLLVLLGVGSALAMKFFANTVGKNLVEKAIESKTGVKTNISDLENGKMTFTDSKTGAKVNIGSGEVPDTFPKDFPLYPGAKVTSSLSGAESGEGSGFWLTLATPDALDKVTAYYKKELAASGWNTESTFSANDTTTQGIKKGDWQGSLSIGKSDDETQIVIILGEDK
ncbi:hypothetical protein HZB58_02995 [Candidatus Gottesmanbacteria bacterium]|nr:hypothetical protein [Candidatus Gottesmanbacteria bacterium]